MQWRASSALVGLGAGSVLLLRYLRRRRARLLREERAAEAAEARRATLEKFKREVEDEEGDTSLTSKSIEDLLDDLRHGRVSAEQVLRAFTLKALQLSTAEINCVTEPVPNAMEIARYCDERFAKKEQLGLLHGLPVSIKENLDIQDMHSTAGLTSNIGLRDKDCVLVQILKAHGAVPFVKTNIPQAMLAFECSNPIYGISTNPHDPSRGPGGSTGGDAALLAVGGSVCGIGTDIGGSTRIPPAFCGVVGLKPTGGRVSGVGVQTVMEGFSGVGKTAGPQSRTVAGCRLLMQALCSEIAWKLDSNVVPVPFNMEMCTQKRKLRIGYYDDDGFFTPTPAYRRAVQVAKEALERAGHECVPFTPPSVTRAMELFYCILGADCGETLLRKLKYDAVDVANEHLVRLARWPRFLQSLSRLFGRLFGSQSIATLCQIRERSVAEYWQLAKQRQEYIDEFTTEWKSHGLDCLICPPNAMGPAPLGYCGKIFPTICYTVLFNLLNYPAGVVPVTKVTAEDEAALADHPCESYWDRLIVKLSAGTTGLPVNVQCVALPWQDEQCLYVMQELEDSLKMEV